MLCFQLGSVNRAYWLIWALRVMWTVMAAADMKLQDVNLFFCTRIFLISTCWQVLQLTNNFRNIHNLLQHTCLLFFLLRNFEFLLITLTLFDTSDIHSHCNNCYRIFVSRTFFVTIKVDDKCFIISSLTKKKFDSKIRAKFVFIFLMSMNYQAKY